MTDLTLPSSALSDTRTNPFVINTVPIAGAVSSSSSGGANLNTSINTIMNSNMNHSSGNGGNGSNGGGGGNPNMNRNRNIGNNSRSGNNNNNGGQGNNFNTNLGNSLQTSLGMGAGAGLGAGVGAAAGGVGNNGGVGRRVTIGGMNTSMVAPPSNTPSSSAMGNAAGTSSGAGGNGGGAGRRPSLGFDAAALNELFMRRNSGFGPAAGGAGPADPLSGLAAVRRSSGFADFDMLAARRDSILGGGMATAGLAGPAGVSVGRRDSLLGNAGGGMDRRNSLDSTTAVIDAAIMDLTRRRLSMAMGTTPAMGGAGGGAAAADFNNPSAFAPTDQMMAAAAAGFPMGGFGPGSLLGGAHNHHPGNNAGNAGAGVNMNNNMASFGRNPGAPSASAVNAITAQQQQMHELQRELDRRKKQLEMEHQQILRGIEEGKMAMTQLQQNLASKVNNTLGAQQFPNAQGHPLLMGRSGAAVAGGGGAGAGMGAMQTGGNMTSVPPGWFVCQCCNNKAFPSQEEAFAHESVCVGQLRNNMFGGMNANNGNAANNAVHGMNNFSNLANNNALNPAALGGLDADLAAFMNANGSTMSNAAAMGLANTAPNTITPVSPKRRLSLDTSAGSRRDAPRKLSTGPFIDMKQPQPLSMSSDRDWLTPLHCFVRRHCVEIFTASAKHVAAPSKGKRKPIQVGQVGIRCPHCHSRDDSRSCERGSVYYPTSIASIYNATMNLLQRHLHCCSSVPEDIMQRYETLKADDARSGTSKRYWVDSARSLGLVDTASGIRFSACTPPQIPNLSKQQASIENFDAVRRNSNDFFSSNSNAITNVPANRGKGGNASSSQAAAADSDSSIPQTERNMTQSAPLITGEDEPYATSFSFHLLSQMQPCKFTEADRLGKRKGLPQGFPGLACRHCFGGFGSGRFFPSSIKTLSDTSKTLNVLHNHMMRCRKCPQEVRGTLEKLRTTHDEERAKMKFGSQKAFFARIWDRLHGTTSGSAPARSLKRTLQHNAQLKAAAAAAAAANAMPNIDPRAALMHQFQQQQQQQAGQMPNAAMLDALTMHQLQQEAKRRRMS